MPAQPTPNLTPHDLPSHGRHLLDPGRALFGLTIVAVGALFLLEAFGVLDAGEAVSNWWPALVVAGGLLQLAERPRSPVGPLIVTGIGILLLLDTTGAIQGDAWKYTWPAAAVAVGVAIMLGRPRTVVPEGSST